MRILDSHGHPETPGAPHPEGYFYVLVCNSKLDTILSEGGSYSIECARLWSFTSWDHKKSLGFPNLGDAGMGGDPDREAVIANG